MSLSNRDCFSHSSVSIMMCNNAPCCLSTGKRKVLHVHLNSLILLWKNCTKLQLHRMLFWTFCVVWSHPSNPSFCLQYTVLVTVLFQYHKASKKAYSRVKHTFCHTVCHLLLQNGHFYFLLLTSLSSFTSNGSLTYLCDKLLITSLVILHFTEAVFHHF